MWSRSTQLVSQVASIREAFSLSIHGANTALGAVTDRAQSGKYDFAIPEILVHVIRVEAHAIHERGVSSAISKLHYATRGQ
jgi:hypothetical protein